MAFNLVPPQTVQSVYDAVVHYLSSAKIHFGQGADNAHDEAYWLIQHVSAIPFEKLESEAKSTLDESSLRKITDIVNTRVDKRTPLAYILGRAWYAGLPFNVSSETIIPRSHLVEWIDDGFAPWIDIENVTTVLDLCCGSGCIGLAIAKYFEHISVDLVDISTAVLEVTQSNIDSLLPGARVRAIQSNLFDQLPVQAYDLIVCNPPYVSEELMQEYPEEFKAEPVEAHWAGDDGLLLVRRILAQASQWLSKDGYLIMELGSAAPKLDAAYPQAAFQWLMSESGESVVLIATRSELEVFAHSS